MNLLFYFVYIFFWIIYNLFLCGEASFFFFVSLIKESKEVVLFTDFAL